MHWIKKGLRKHAAKIVFKVLTCVIISRHCSTYIAFQISMRLSQSISFIRYNIVRKLDIREAINNRIEHFQVMKVKSEFYR